MRLSFLTRTILRFLLACALFGAPAVPAMAHTTLKVVRYKGVSLQVPRAWPVLRLSKNSTVCVRFNRHAVYLGRPGSAQRCPVNSRGRTEAILVEPPGSAGASVYGSGVTVARARRTVITATWRTDPGTIRTALALHSLSDAKAPRAIKVPRFGVKLRPTVKRAVSAAVPATPGGVYEGEGFDACSTQSESTMSAWGSSSPYGAVGVYIGGENMACSQSNLTSSWVSTESAAGWHIVPIYVGLQAPGNSCGCAALSPPQAAAEGAAAATDAVSDAQSVGMGPGNPIYYDMEGYRRSSATSSAVLAFLQAWTEQLHTDGYRSGVYSSDDSGIADLTSSDGSAYVEPDDIWFAAWNGQANVSDSSIPSDDWAANQRLHQYQGGINETYDGVTINVDNDDLDAATAGYGSSSSPAAAAIPTVPAATARPGISGIPVVGQTLTESHGTWTGSPASYTYQWYRCTSTGTGCAAISGAIGQTYTLTGADSGRTLYVGEAAANAIGSATASSSPHTASVAIKASGFWSFTATGAVLNSEYQLLWGSPGSYGLHDFAGMATTAGRRGYWLVTRHGTVYGFGNATAAPAIRIAHPIEGIVRAPGHGYWLYTADGNVYASRGTSLLGSPANRHLTNVSGMAALPNASGYWVSTRSGAVYAFGRAPAHRRIKPARPVIGIVSAPNHGYWLYTACGNVYNSAGAGYYGSPARSHISNVAAMLATPDGKGYWLITHAGRLYAYGDATQLPDPPASAGSIVGMAG